MKRDIMDEARGRWAGLLPRFGLSMRALGGKHGPCPMCGGKDRFRFDDKGGNGTYICNQCGAGNGIRLVMQLKGWDFRTAAAEVRALLPGMPITSYAGPTPESRARTIRLMWDRALPIGGSQAGQYLAARSPALAGVTKPVLRFLRDCPISDVPDRMVQPAMIAGVSAPDGSLATLHRTYLDGDRKAALLDTERRPVSPRKLMPCELAPGSAIRLSPAGETLGVCEGIETGLAVERLFGVPCWAVINSSMLAKFVVPAGVRRLIVFGDNDPKFGGQAAAWALAHRAAVSKAPPEAIEVEIPPITGTDWLDVLNGER